MSDHGHHDAGHGHHEEDHSVNVKVGVFFLCVLLTLWVLAMAR